MSERTIQRILEKYGLEWSEILTPAKGYRNQSWPVILTNKETVNIIIHKSEPGALSLLMMADAVSGYLYDKGVPTRKMQHEKVLKLTAGPFTQYAAVYNYLPGATIPWEAYTMRHIKLLGESLSNLHADLKRLPYARELPDVANQYFAIVTRMNDYFEAEGVRRAMAQKLKLETGVDIFKRHKKLLGLCKNLPDQQALHMDFVRGNILFDNEAGRPTVSGILDFEKTAYGHPVFDMARTLAFLLVDCKYKTEEKIRKYFLLSGYNKRGLSSFSEMSLLEELVDLFLLYDFYKFLKHNPYEFLQQNEHFTRTCRLLLSRHIVARIDRR